MWVIGQYEKAFISLFIFYDVRPYNNYKSGGEQR